MQKSKKLSVAEKDELIKKLKDRFERNMHRHSGITWKKVEGRLDTVG